MLSLHFLDDVADELAKMGRECCWHPVDRERVGHLARSGDWEALRRGQLVTIEHGDTERGLLLLDVDEVEPAKLVLARKGWQVLDSMPLLVLVEKLAAWIERKRVATFVERETGKLTLH